MKFSGWLWRMARMTRDVEAVSTGNPAKIAKRAQNRVVGRLIWRLIRRAYK